MAERTAILIDSDGDPVGTLTNPLIIVASGSGHSDVASLPDLSDVTLTTAADGDYLGYDETTGKYINKPVTGSGMGDVTGPSSATDRSVAIFDDTTGKFINDTNVLIDEDDQIDMQNAKIVNLAAPTENSDAATKYYVDQFVQGLTWQDPVVSIEVSSPADPADRARYIVDEGAVGDWIGHSDDIAIWYADEGAWHFTTPEDGWASYNEELGEVMVYNEPDSVWHNIGTGGVPEAPVDNYPYCRMNSGWVRTSSDGSGILPLAPVSRNCLLAFNDEYGYYAKEADRGAFVKDGLFIRTPYGTGIGEYLLKLYAGRDTNTYAGILDLRDYYGCADNAHPLIGFVSNMIKSAVASPFGGGLLINAHGPFGPHYPETHNPNVALAVKPEGGTTVIEGLRVYESGIVECRFGVNIPTGKTYDINGVPHAHSEYLLLSGGTLTGILDAGDNRIRNVGTPVSGADAVNLDYVGSLIGGVIWQNPIESIETASPDSPVDGERYLVASPATGVFAGHENEIVTFVVDHWGYTVPDVGWCVANKEDNFAYAYNGSIWAQMPGASSHSALQNLDADDHSQYLHLTIPRVITAVPTFLNGFSIAVSTTVPNLSASYLDGVTKAGFALVDHTHELNVMTDVQVSSPEDGQILVYDEDLEKFVNSTNSGAVVIDPDHEFEDDTERDAYFVLNPGELVEGMFIVVGTGFQQLISGTFEDRTPMIRGPAGLDGRDGIDGADGAAGIQGPAGEQGEQGPQGIQGPAGESGTTINLLGAVASPDDLPETATLHDAYIVDSDGDLYIWSDDDAWHNIGMVAGPQGLQGVAGPQGPQGVQGVAGPRGAKGDIGLTGPEGVPGPRGPSGYSIGWESPVEARVASPVDNYDYEDRFLVASPATGDYEGHENEIATWLDTDQWYFDSPILGSMVYVLEVASYYERTQSGWEVFSSGGGGVEQVNSDWNALLGVASILNKPTIPDAQVNSDWNALVGVASILNKPTIPEQYVLPTASADTLGGVKIGSGVTITDGVISVASGGGVEQVNSDWNAAVGVASILNKPIIPDAQVNADWNAVVGVASILNKPTTSNTIIAIRAGEYLRKGQAVYIDGTSSGIPLAWKCDCTNTDKSRAIGCVTADMNPGDATIDGFVIRSGVVTGIDCRTTGTVAGYVNPLQQTWANGDLLFALGGANAGGLTNVRPTSGRSVKVGYAVNGNDSAGKILVYPMENPVWITGASGENVVLRLGDAVGANCVSIRDYANTQVASIDSDGKFYGNGAGLTGIIVASATPTTLGTVKIGTNVVASADGTISVVFPESFSAVSLAYSLPTPVVGKMVDVVGKGSNWTVTASNDAVIQMGADASVANGVLSSTNGYDCVTLICISATKWVVKSAFGSFTLV